MADTCDVPKCRNGVEVTYYRHGVCNECFRKHCDEKSRFDLKEIFKIAPAKKGSFISDQSLPVPQQEELVLSKGN